MRDLTALIAKLEQCEGSDNALDMEIEIALFRPDKHHVSVRPNAAGTKLVYTRPDGRDETHLAWDWTMHKDRAVAALRALLTSPASRAALEASNAQ